MNVSDTEADMIGRFMAILNHFDARPHKGYTLDEIREFGIEWPQLPPPKEITKEAVRRLEDGGYIEQIEDGGEVKWIRIKD